MGNNILFFVRLDTIRKKAKGADGRIADYILSHPDTLPSLTVQALAENTGTGYATVCRFFKKLGVSGFREFKQFFALEWKSRAPAEDVPQFGGGRQDSFEAVRDKICNYTAGVIGSFDKILKPEEFDRAATVMRSAKQLHFIGLGVSAVTARYAYDKFFRMNGACSFDNDIILSRMKATQMDARCVLFAISSSGRTKSILEIARIAREKGATVISVCDFTAAPLTALSDISICTTVRESNKYIDTDFPLLQGQITIIDILYSYMYGKVSAANADRVNEAMHAISVEKVKY